jgi:hypothetical protein
MPTANQNFTEAHRAADTDFEPTSMHHTLGKGGLQAAPGNHNHDEVYAPYDHNFLHDDFYMNIDYSTPYVRYSGAQRVSNADFAIPNATETNIRWPTVNKSDIGSLNRITNPNTGVGSNGRIFFNEPGQYRVEYTITFASNATGTRQAFIKDSSGITIGYQSVLATSALGCTVTAWAEFEINQGMIDSGTNWIDTRVQQSSGGALALFGGSIGFATLVAERKFVDPIPI